eukprot:4966310-Amphidinium_carterae.1
MGAFWAPDLEKLLTLMGCGDNGCADEAGEGHEGKDDWQWYKSENHCPMHRQAHQLLLGTRSALP